MYKNLKIGAKLTIGFASVVLVSIALMIFTLSCLSQVGTLSHSMYTGPYVSTTEAMGLRSDLNLIGKDIRSAIISKDVAKYKTSIKDTKAVLDGRIVTIESVFGGDKQLIVDFKNAMTGLVAERDKVFAALDAGDYDKASNLVLTSYADAFAKSYEAANVIYADAHKRAEDFDTQSQKSAATAMFVSIALLAAAVVLAMVMALVSTRSITNPMKEVIIAATQMASGSLNVDVKYTSKDELGTLATSFRTIVEGISKIIKDIDYLLGQMADGNFNVTSTATNSYIGDYAPILTSIRNIHTKLSDTLGQINQSSDQVSRGSEQVSSGSQALSQGATEQASSIEELAATINEISEQIKDTANNSKLAKELTDVTGTEVNTSNRQMQELINAMHEISASSSEIGKIIKTIEDIAFQTNILALNAAVEAARAGQAGKGFAVVADEVRNLASKSAEASKNTSVLIENSIKSVENGTRIADSTARSLSAVVESSKNVVDIVDKISSATQQQSASVAQVTQGLEQISAVVQTNSATAEESAAASEELSGQAEMLKELVGTFHLKGVPSNQAKSSKPSISLSHDFVSDSSKY